jgi:ATP-binding cassette subfamily C exporter for protease/lipase
MREVYGPVVTARSDWTLAMVTLLLVLFLVMAAALDWVRQRVLSAASVRLAQAMGQKVFDATFKANLAGFPGAKMALNDFRQVRQFMASPTAGVILDAPIGLMLLGLIFIIHPVMGLMSLFGAALSLIISLLTERAVRPVMAEAVERNQIATAYATETVRSAEAVAAMGMQGAVQARWALVQEQYLVKQAQATNVQAAGMASTKMVMLVQGSALLGVGTFLTLIGVLSPAAGAMLIVAKLIGAIAIRPMMQLITSWKQVAVAWDSLKRLREFMAKIPETQDTMELPPPKGVLTLQGATVVAPGTKTTILLDLSFSVSPGQVLAVLGPSGSGKSSLARLLTGIWAPRLGEVRLDGASIARWPKHLLGPHVGYLPQDVELFDGTVAENIARFGEIDASKLEQAIEDTGLATVLADLPAGLDTQLGADGARLSGGQRQRIGLARAFYGQPQLLVLDEPNASLDQAGDDALSQAVSRAKARGATVVLITHRPEILAASDLLLVLKDGKPVVFGPTQTVLAEIKSKAAA